MSAEVTYTIEPAEWARVAALARAADLDEAAGEAIWLSDYGHERLWVAQTYGGPFVLRGGDSSGEYVHLGLSPRLAHAAQFLGERAQGPTTLTVTNDETAVVTAGGATVAIGLIRGESPYPPIGYEWGDPEAQVPAGDLYRLIECSRLLPGGVDNESPSGQPFYWLGIGDEVLTVHVDWRAAGAPRASYWVPATGTDKGTITVAVNHGLLTQAVTHLPQTPDEFVTLVLTDTQFIEVRGSDWWAFINTVDGTVTRWAEELERHLTAAEVEFTKVSERVYEYGRRVRVRAELHGGDREIVRLSTVLAHGITPSLEVLTEINEANAGLVGVRLWLQDDVVVASSDLPCQRLGDLVPASATLAAQVSDLGVFLTALASGLGSEPC